MIGTQELKTAFDAIGLKLRVTPLGLDFRVTPGQPGIDVQVWPSASDDEPAWVEVCVNFLRIVDMQLIEVDVEDRYLVLAVDDWGDCIDAPPRVFRIGVDGDETYVDEIREFSAEE